MSVELGLFKVALNIPNKQIIPRQLPAYASFETPLVQKACVPSAHARFTPYMPAHDVNVLWDEARLAALSADTFRHSRAYSFSSPFCFVFKDAVAGTFDV
jgi:hypothetical protein